MREIIGSMDEEPGSAENDHGIDFVALFINARARKGVQLREMVVSSLQRRGIRIAASLVTHNPFDLVEAIAHAIDGGLRYIIIGGGDGTLSLAIDRFVNRDAVLGIIPLGTQNAFATSLGIPQDVEAALDIISVRHDVHLDLGAIDGNYFITTTSLGVSSLALLLMTHRVKSILGVFSYALVGLRVLWKYPSFTCIVKGNGHIHRHRTHEMMIINRHYLHMLPEGVRPKIDNGGLIILPIGNISRWHYIIGWLATVTKRSWGMPPVKSYTMRECIIDAQPIMPVNLDGDVLAMTPVQVTFVPKAVRVLVPSDYPHSWK